MKITKKILSIIIIAVMVMALSPFTFAATESYEQIKAGASKTINASRDNPITYYQFKAPEDGLFVFWSKAEGDADPYIHLLNSDGDIMSSDDDYSGYDFKLSYYMEKNEVYIIRATLYDMYSKGTYKLSVAKETAPTGIELDVADTLTMYPGQTEYINYTLLPGNAKNAVVEWTTSNEGVANITTNGAVGAVAKGTATLTATIVGTNVKKSVKVTVKDPTALTLGKTVSGSFARNGAEDVYSFTPKTAGYYTVKAAADYNVNLYFNVGGMSDWGVAPQAHAYLEAGVTYDVVISDDDSMSGSYKLTVSKSVAAKEITMYINGNYYVGESAEVEVYSADDGIFIDEPVITSSNNAVAEYKDGTLNFKKAGTATVTVKAGSVTVSEDVTVKKVPVITVSKPLTTTVDGTVAVDFTATEDGVYRITAESAVGAALNIATLNDIGSNSVEIILSKDEPVRLYVYPDDYEAYDEKATISVQKLVQATGMSIAQGKNITAYAGSYLLLDAVFAPANSAPESVEWQVTGADEYYNYYSSCEILLDETGTVNVTATSESGHSATTTITVKEAPVIKPDTDKKLDVTTTRSFAYKFVPEKSGFYTAILDTDGYGEAWFYGEDEYSAYSWDTSIGNTTTSYLEKGKTYYLTIYVEDATEAAVKIINSVYATSMDALMHTLTVGVGDRIGVPLMFGPDYAIVEQISAAKSSNSAVADVDGYFEIIAKKEGTATIKMTSEYGLEATVTVNVVGDDYVWAEYVDLNEYELSLNVGEAQKLTAIIEPEAAADHPVYWETEDESVARVTADGTVIATGAGETFVYAWCDDIVLYCYVTVEDVALKDSSKVFKDVVKGKWYQDAIDYCYTYGFIAGMKADEFGINTPVTRGMFITVLARIAGVDTDANDVTTKFKDVQKGRYYTAAIKWANENGVVSGMTETTFAPNSPLQRQQLCVMIVNFANYVGVEIDAVEKAVTFADAKDIATYAKEKVAICQQADIVNGYSEGGKLLVKPMGTATRAEAAQILYKFHKDFFTK